MAIAAISGVGAFNGTAAAVVPRQLRAAPPAPSSVASFTDPSAIVSLGTGAPAGTLFDVAGLLRALLQVDAGSIAPPAPEPGSREARLQGDLGTLLGLNADTTGAGIPTTTGAFRSLSPDAAPALGNVLATGLGETTPEEAEAALNRLLASAANFTATGLNPAATAAGVVEATGLLQASGVATGPALNSLLGSDLGLAAAVLNTNAASAGTAGILLNPAGDATGRALATVLAANLELAVADVTVAEGDGTVDVLLSNIDLTAAQAGIATAAAAVAAAATTPLTGEAAATALVALATPVVGAAPAPAAPAVPEAEPPAASTTAAAAPTPAPAAPATATPTVPAQAAASVLEALVSDAATRARATVAGDPTYAFAAATMYAGAVVFRYRVQDVVPGAAIPTRPVPVVPGIVPSKGR